MSCKNCITKTNEVNNTNKLISPSPQWITYKAKKNRKGKNVVLVSGDEEYRSEEALPQLAKILTQHHGFDCTILFAQNPEKPGIIAPNYRYNIPGLEQLKTADLLILFIRFRTLPSEQMRHVEDYLMKGKPLIAIRTATHAFNFEEKNHPFCHYGHNYKEEKTNWHLGFGKFILGETWHAHHGVHKHQSTRGIIAPNEEKHPIVNGIGNGEMWGPTNVYRIRMPIGEDSKIIFLGQSIDREGEFDKDDAFYGMKESDCTSATQAKQWNQKTIYNPNESKPPLVWLKSYQLLGGKTGQSLTSTIGAAVDIVNEQVRRLFINSAYYLLDLEVPAKANVNLIGDYKPTSFASHKDEYWDKKQLKIGNYST